MLLLSPILILFLVAVLTFFTSRMVILSILSVPFVPMSSSAVVMRLML
nr:MAG TPA: hypothetical protein [Microviridae sp.]